MDLEALGTPNGQILTVASSVVFAGLDVGFGRATGCKMVVQSGLRLWIELRRRYEGI